MKSQEVLGQMLHFHVCPFFFFLDLQATRALSKPLEVFITLRTARQSNLNRSFVMDLEIFIKKGQNHKSTFWTSVVIKITIRTIDPLCKDEYNYRGQNQPLIHCVDLEKIKKNHEPLGF